MGFGERLRAARIENGLTQAQLGRLLGVSDGAVRMWELGHREPDIDMLGRIAAIVGVTVDYLVSGTEPPRNSRETDDPIYEQNPWLFRLPASMRHAAAEMLRADFLRTAVFRGGTGINFDNLDDEALRRLVAELIRFYRDSEDSEDKGKTT